MYTIFDMTGYTQVWIWPDIHFFGYDRIYTCFDMAGYMYTRLDMPRYTQNVPFLYPDRSIFFILRLSFHALEIWKFVEKNSLN